MTVSSPTSEPLPEEGTLTDISFSELLLRAAREKKTGTLHIRDDKVNKTFLFQMGLIRGSHSNLPGESLARMVVVRQKTTREVVQGLGVPLLQDDAVMKALLKGNIVSAPEIEEVFRYQLVNRLADVFVRDEARFAWRPSGEPPVRVAVNPYQIFAEGLARRVPPEKMSGDQAAMADVVVRAVAKPVFPLDLGTLPPGARQLFGFMDGKRSLAALVERLVANVAPEQKEKAVYRAWVYLMAFVEGGYVEVVDASAAAAEASSHPSPPAAPASAPASSPAPAAAPAGDGGNSVIVFNGSGSAVSYEEVDDPEFTQRFEQMSEQNFFEVLDLSGSPTDREVKRAYFKVAKQFHPDKLYDHQGRTVKKHADKLFSLINRAYEQLRTEDGRKEYETKLRELAEGIDLDRDAEKMLNAEIEFQKGAAMMRKRDFAAATIHFQAALDLNSREAEHHLYLGWARFQSCYPADESGWRKAVTEIHEGLNIDPDAVQGLFFLATIFKVTGDMDKAEEFFGKVLKKRPHHVEAQRELRLMEQRRSKEAESKGKRKIFK